MPEPVGVVQNFIGVWFVLARATIQKKTHTHAHKFFTSGEMMLQMYHATHYRLCLSLPFTVRKNWGSLVFRLWMQNKLTHSYQ
jgi:hypothetical protein